jgi:hypothetical protein
MLHSGKCCGTGLGGGWVLCHDEVPFAEFPPHSCVYVVKHFRDISALVDEILHITLV